MKRSNEIMEGGPRHRKVGGVKLNRGAGSEKKKAKSGRNRNIMKTLSNSFVSNTFFFDAKRA